MTKKETIQVLQSIEDRAADFPYMTECDWVAIAAAKRHLAEELVSEDLEETAKEYVTKEGYLAGLHYNSMVRSFKAGAKWQNEKNKQWLADNHKHIFNNGFEEGFEAGRDDMEEQLKKDAIPAIVMINKYGNKYISSWAGLSQYDEFNKGDKVKLIFVKED